MAGPTNQAVEGGAMRRGGALLFAVGLAGLGKLSLLYDDYAMVWQPVPEWVPFHNPLAYLSGAVLLIGGLGMLFRRTAGWANLVLAAFVLSWLVLLQVPRVLSKPLDGGMWCGLGETTLLASGAWALFFSRAAINAARPGVAESAGRCLRVCRYAFGAALPAIGLSHFLYPGGTASMVPAYIPFPSFWGYFTGSAHVLAGLAILAGVLPALAAALEAAMITGFVLLLHLPGVAAHPRDRLQWTMLFIATAYAGSAWAVASSLRRAAPGPGGPASEG
jgi:uncharacterized membrane protein